MPIDWRAPNATYIVLEVDGERFDFFHDYSVQLDLLNPGGEFHFSASLIPGKRGVRANLGARGLAPGRKVQLKLVTPSGQTLQHTGKISDVVYDLTTKAGSTISVTVYDHMRSLVHADVVPTISIENVTFGDIVRTVAFPFGFAPSDITVDADAARLLMTGKPAAGARLSAKAPLDIETMKVDQAMPNAGENAFAYLQRHARRFGLMIWGTADGRIIVGRPDYEQPVRYDFVARSANKGVNNNVQAIKRKVSFAQRPSAVHVYGKSHGGDWLKSSVHAVVYDEEVRQAGIYAPITVHDGNAKDETQARERAEWELGRRRQTADIVQVSLARHCARDGTAYAIDTMAHVAFENAGLDADMYVVRRTFNASRGAGTDTTLDLVPKYALSMGDGIISAPKFNASRGVKPSPEDGNKYLDDPAYGPAMLFVDAPTIVRAATPISEPGDLPGVVKSR